MAVSIVQPAPRQGRVQRNPRHTFIVEHKPFVLQPLCIAPVLPGETLNRMTFQSRAVTKPIANPLIGWWLEYYFFYVKHRDLVSIQTDLIEMVLDPDKNMSAHEVAADDAFTYARDGQPINWTKLCLERVVDCYFRNADEPVNSGVTSLGGKPLVKISHDSWAQSAILSSLVAPEPDTELVVGADDKITGREVDDLMRRYETERAYGYTDMTYEDWLGTYGVSTRKEALNEPELLRYVREWQYPSSTIDPTNGVPSSVVSWAVAETADKKRFFKEPGFIVGYTVARPKVYLDNQMGAFAHWMADAMAWHPAILRDDPWASMREYASGAGPAGVTGANYWVDLRDGLLYGDQFLALIDGTKNSVELPSPTGLNILYPDSTSIDALFTGASKHLSQDGVVQFNISGTQRDTTPVMRQLG